MALKWTASVIIVLVLVNMADGMENILKKTGASKEVCVFKPWAIQLYRRGQYQRPQNLKEALESLNLSDTDEICTSIGKEVQCNDANYMLSYLHLTFPWDNWYPDQVEILHRDINEHCPEWARKMLAIAFKVAQNDEEMEVPWMFYLYVKRIETYVSAAKDPNKIQLLAWQAAHYGMYKVLLCTMFQNDCTMFDPETNEERNFPQYLAKMDWSSNTYYGKSENTDRVLKLLKKHWPDLRDNCTMGCRLNEAGTSSSVPSVQSVTENDLTLDLLYLDGVFDNAKGTTLLTEFGVFQNGKCLLNYLNAVILNIKNDCTLSFEHYVTRLVNYHEHVQRALKTMMWRIYYDFLEKLKMLSKDLWEEHFAQFSKPYNDWCDFLCMPLEKDSCVNVLDQLWYSVDTLSEKTILRLQKWVITSLEENDGMTKLPLFNYKSLDMINIDKSWIIDTAKEYDIPLDARFRAVKDLPNNHIQTTILCAEVLVEFLKKIFSHVNFNAIQSLIKLGTSTTFKRYRTYSDMEKYETGMFTPEFEARTIDVCRTHIISLNIDK